MQTVSIQYVQLPLVYKLDVFIPVALSSLLLFLCGWFGLDYILTGNEMHHRRHIFSGTPSAVIWCIPNNGIVDTSNNQLKGMKSPEFK